MSVAAFRWRSDGLNVLDQRLLPHKLVVNRCKTPEQVAEAIRLMAVRGAPAIGCCAAYGVVLAAKQLRSRPAIKPLERACARLKSARPTAVNLAWAVDRMLVRAGEILAENPTNLYSGLLQEAEKIENQDRAINRAMGRAGAKLFGRNSVILTHCNAGALATAGHGTALGIVRELKAQKKLKKVFVDETRPYMQGARLTAWELSQEKIPHDLITDNMAGHFMRTERIDGVIVGCDRVAANGDTANKIGTYSVAVLARHHGIPFYVAMPLSTLDLSVPTGAGIPIEERSQREVTEWNGSRIAPKDSRARHPAFDVTPARLITAFVTEFGVVKPPFTKNFKKLKQKSVR